MTKLIAIIGFLICSASVVMAQNRTNIKGMVIDSTSNTPVEFATVAVVAVSDSSLVSYTATLKNGQFALHNLPADKSLKLIVSFVGYLNFRKLFTLKKGDMLDMGAIKLNGKTNALNEVKITAGASPIVMKKDTIEFSAEAFKTPPNAVVEELLRRLPGIEIDMNGNISINGKPVKKLMIDGKQYFANDPRIASKNLDAALIDKIQVYDDRDDDPDHLIPEARVGKIINLKLKSAIKKSTSGKLYGGAGTRARFNAGLLYNMFRDTLQVSVIGVGNNLNHTGFSDDDLTNLGGFNRTGSDALDASSLRGGDKNEGIETEVSGGVNINNDIGKTLKLNLLYYYSHTSDVFDYTNFSRQAFGDTTLSTSSTVNLRDITNRHNISGLLEWKPDTNTKVRYQPMISFDSKHSIRGNNDYSFNNFSPLLNTNNGDKNDQSNNFQFKQAFSYYHKFSGRGASLSINHNLTINPGSELNYNNNDFISYALPLTSANLHRLEDNDQQNTDASINIVYRYPFTKKLRGDVSFYSSYTHSNGRHFTYNQQPEDGQYTAYIDSLSNNLIRRQFTETAQPELSYQFNKDTRLAGGLGVELVQLYNQFSKNIPDINRSEIHLLPSLVFSAPGFSVGYDENINQPAINELYPYTTFYNSLYSTRGNPNLKPGRSRTLSANFYSNKTERMLNITLNAQFSLTQPNVFNETSVNSQGATLLMPVNKTGVYNFYVGGTIDKGFKKFNNWQLRVYDNVSYYFNHSFFQVNNITGFQNSSEIYFTQYLVVNWNNRVQFNPNYSISPEITTYQLIKYPTIKYIKQHLDLPLTLQLISHTTFEADYAHNYNQLAAPGFKRSINILNLSIARQFQYRDRGEIKLSCYDLFDQNVGAYRYVDGTKTVDIQNQILKRYFLLTYSYRFSSTTVKKQSS